MIAFDVATRHSSAMSDSRNAVEPEAHTSRAPIWAAAAESFRLWLGGDQGAIDRLVAVMNPVLWHVVRAYRLDEMTTKDVIQETWMTLLRKHTSVADPQAVAAWLTTTARREAWRVVNRERRDVPAEDYQLDAAMESAPSAEVVALSAIDDSLLWRSVLTLNPNWFANSSCVMPRFVRIALTRCTASLPPGHAVLVDWPIDKTNRDAPRVRTSGRDNTQCAT